MTEAEWREKRVVRAEVDVYLHDVSLHVEVTALPDPGSQEVASITCRQLIICVWKIRKKG